MEVKNTMEYSAFVYQDNDYFIADCGMLNLITAGKTMDEALDNLHQVASNLLKGSKFLLKPILERR